MTKKSSMLWLDFNGSAFAADFALWARKAHWELEEGATLLLGRNPEMVKLGMVPRPHDNADPIVRAFAEIVDRANRAVACGQLTRPVSPGAFLAWAKDDGFDVPVELERCVRERGELVSDRETHINRLERQLAETSVKLSEKTTSTAQLALENERLKNERDTLQRQLLEGFRHKKERTSVFKIMLGAVYAGWKFNPLKRDNEGNLGKMLSEIETDTGLKVDRGTARQWLEAAATHLDWHLPEKEN